MTQPHRYTFGIEEEFFLVRPRTGAAVLRKPDGLMRALRRALGEQVGHELLQSQIETNTTICTSLPQARAELLRLRGGLCEVLAAHGLACFAAGTHPLGEWREHAHTEQPRYARLMDDFQIIGRRNLLCGLHVHVAPPPGVDRIVVINRLLPWLPLFLALSTSSPFWHRHPTGLSSYRQAAYDEWPRTGIPDFFADEAEFDRFVALLVQSGSLKDASFLWWAIRPSVRFPTVELRIADACTLVEDSLTIAALFRCLVRAASRNALPALPASGATRLLIEENRWRAKRYGTEAGLLDYRDGGVRPFRVALDELLALLAEDIVALDQPNLPDDLAALLKRGTSAQQQLALYQRLREAGVGREAALRAVVDWLIAHTQPAASDACSTAEVSLRPAHDDFAR